MPARRKELPSSFWQRCGGLASISLSVGFMSKRTAGCNDAVRTSGSARLSTVTVRGLAEGASAFRNNDSVLTSGSARLSTVTSVALAEGASAFRNGKKFDGWHIGCSLRCNRNVDRAIRIPKDEIPAGSAATAIAIKYFVQLGCGSLARRNNGVDLHSSGSDQHSSGSDQTECGTVVAASSKPVTGGN